MCVCVCVCVCLYVCVRLYLGGFRRLSTYQVQIRPLSSRAQGFRPRTEEAESDSYADGGRLKNDDDSSDDEVPLIVENEMNELNS